MQLGRVGSMRRMFTHLSRYLGTALTLTLLVCASEAQTPAGRLLRLEVIQVLPAGGAEERIVRSVLPFREGDAVGSGDLVQVKKLLERSRFFEDLDVYTSRGSQLGDVVLHVNATFDRSVQFETGFGHQPPLLGWYLNIVGLRWNSPWGGGGHVRAVFRIGQRLREFYLDASKPRLGNAPVDLRIDAGAGDEDWLIYDGDRLLKQEIGRARLYLGLRAHLAKGVHTTLWAGPSAANPDDRLQDLEGTEDDNAGTLVPEPQRETYGDLTFEFAVDRRDAQEPWRKGAWFGMRARGSIVQDGKPFWRGDADGRVGLPLPIGGALAVRGRFIYTDPATPYHLRAVVGGMGSIRGFRDASLSGPMGARGAWQTSAELRIPLVARRRPPPHVTGVLFVDFGDHWDSAGNRFGLSVGAGYGVRVRVPWIHVFGLDVGIPLTTTPTKDPFWIHGSLGFTY